MCLFKLCCLVFEFVFGGGDAIFNHQCCKHRVHLWHKARSVTVWSRMLWQGVVSLGTAVSDFLLLWFPCDWTSLASGAAWNRTRLAWLIFRLSSALETVQPVRLDGHLKVHCSWFKTPENQTFLMMIRDNAIWQIRGRTWRIWSLRNSFVLKCATQIHFPWLAINTLTVLCTDYLDSHLHRRHLHLMNKKKTG